MAWFGNYPGTPAGRLATFCLLWSGVMADSLDSSLIGVISAGVVVFCLIITIIIFIIFCCYRRMESSRKAASDRNSVLTRKDSGSVSTNGIAPRWAPVYSVPAEPVIYAMPASHYYLGHYSPKFIDAKTLEHMRHEYVDPDQASEHMEVLPDVHHFTRHSESRAEHVTREAVHEKQEVAHERKEVVMQERQEVQGLTQQRQEIQEVTQQRQEVQEVTQERQEVQGVTGALQGEVITTTIVQQKVEAAPPSPQSNEFAASSENYRVIRKQHKHEKMPEWLIKTYGENEKTLDLGDESSTSGEDGGEDLLIPPMPAQVTRADASPHHSFLDSEDILKVPRDFTIVDYVDTERRQTGGSSYVLSTAGAVTTAGGGGHEGKTDVSAITDVSTTRHVTSTSDVTSSDSGRMTTTTTRVVTTTTTLYNAEGAVEEGSLAATEASSYPVSTSTPRFQVSLDPPSPPPPPPVPQIEVRRVEEAGMSSAGSSGDLVHYRMRLAGQGSLSKLPQALAASGGDWD